eukprot:jgi/Undpi1/2147/HiC_scaffold_12.g05533.m1
MLSSRGMHTGTPPPGQSQLIREKLDQLNAQLVVHSASGGTGKGEAKENGKGQEVAVATLRLLTSVARFHRLAAKELGGVFNFSHKAFIKLVSSKGGGGSSSGAASVSDATTGTGQAQEGDGVEAVAGAAGGGKKAKRKRKAAEAAAAAAAASRRENGDTTAENGRERKGSQDIRHLSVEFLCAFMDSEDSALQMQMVTGARGGGSLGLIFRGSLWRDLEATSLLVVETLHRRLLRNRRVSRRAKADFFSAATIEHLRKVFDNASPPLYESLHGFMSSLLCNPAISPFLIEVEVRDSGSGSSGSSGRGSSIKRAGDGRDRAVVSWPRPLMAGLACLGAHADLGQRELLLSALNTCPSLLGPYLRSLSLGMLEARPTYHLLQTYSLLSVVLRVVPVARSPNGDVAAAVGAAAAAAEAAVGGGRGAGGSMGEGKAGEVLLSTVMPAALSKKELTKGVLSGSSLLQAATMNLMASILDRSARVTRAAVAATAATANRKRNGDSHDVMATATDGADITTAALPLPIGVAGMVSQLRQRMPEVQTLLGLRDKLGDGSSRASGGDGGGGDDKAAVLRWRLLTVLDRYARAIPGALAASRFDFLKLLPPLSGGGATSTVGGAGAGAAAGGAGAAVSATVSATGLETLHPLVQLATFRLLSREGVLASTQMTGGGAGASGYSSGWLAQKTGGGNVSGGGGGGGGRSGLTTAAMSAAAENTPLGAVLRMSLSAPSRATKAAARALAARALLSLGVVAGPPPRRGGVGSSGGGSGDGDEEEEEEGVVDGEAEVWLGLLTPGAVGTLVVLAREACDNAHALMAAGIRAAEKGMRGEPLVGVAGGGGKKGCGGQGNVGDWDVEFRCAEVCFFLLLLYARVESFSRRSLRSRARADFGEDILLSQKIRTKLMLIVT